MTTTTKLPSEMTITELRAILKANGVAYSGNDRKADLVFKAQKLRYGPNERNGAPVVEPDVYPETGILTSAAIDAAFRPVREPAPKAIEVVDGASRNARTAAANAEHAALKAWAKAQSACPDGTPQPPTPNLDVIAIEAKHDGAKPGKSRSKIGGAPRVKAPKASFAYNGTPAPDGRGLSYIAWAFTKGIDGAAPRLSLADLKALLAKAGITDPEHMTWEHELPNGVTITATLPS